MEQDRIHEIIDWLKGGETKKPTSSTRSPNKYVHYSCSHCKRNVYIRDVSITEDEKNYGIQCGKCTYMLYRGDTIEYNLIPRGSEIIN